ncbi:hypothetical protein ACFC1R_12835 [Kitasatospora sp. NPDC056138]|uniref:hypothetical protein n=1 Tax=Kitasatospora sp. NPDC056138 TaxID=3345724 RepID=UPI0035DEA557
MRSSTSTESWAAVSESMPISPSGRSVGICCASMPSSSPISEDSQLPVDSAVPVRFAVVMAFS